MKILKILLILLIPAMGFVACEKANTKPCSNNKSTKVSSGSADVSGKIVGGVIVDDNTGVTIVGSGDDDRDGGDKKKKVR